MSGATTPGRVGVAGWRIGQLRGVPIYLGATWPIIAVVIVALFGPQVQAARPDLGARAYLIAVVYAVLLLASVLVHEAAHALMAQARGYHVSRIVADLWGGHTAYEQADTAPGSAALVAVVGPLANGGLAVLGWAALSVTPPGVPALLCAALTWTNGFVALFNLLPGLPLDGGFLVDALVWKVTGSRAKGLIVAGWTGRGMVVLVLAWFLLRPLMQGWSPGLFGVVWSLIIGSFLWRGASAAIAAGRGREVLERVAISPLLRPVTLLAEHSPVELARQAGGHVVAQSPERGPWGVLDRAAIERVPLEQQSQVLLAAVCSPQPQGWIVQLGDDGDDATTVVSGFQRSSAAQILVLDQHGHALGIVEGEELGAALTRADPRA